MNSFSSLGIELGSLAGVTWYASAGEPAWCQKARLNALCIFAMTFNERFDLKKPPIYRTMAVATVALVVSLASFVLSALTLFRNLFESAEGYKKCGEPMIGAWSRITWRRWRWFELRLETHFIAPKISIRERLPGNYIPNAAGLTSLRNIKRLNPKASLFSRFSWRPFNLWARSYAFHHCQDVLAEALELEECSREKMELESQRSFCEKFPSDNRVSWLLLLQALREIAKVETSTLGVLSAETAPEQTLPPNQTQPANIEAAKTALAQTPPAQPPQTGATTVATASVESSSTPSAQTTASAQKSSAQTLSGDVAPAENASTAIAPTGSTSPVLASARQASPSAQIKPDSMSDGPSAHDMPQTEFALSFLEWTWDIMPKDATRPMAKTTLGELIILGFRLGLKWEIDLAKESFVAHGHNFILNCARSGDMGLVASITNDRWPDKGYKPPKLIPDRATDKMMCGIIPVPRDLVGEDIHCTSDEGETHVFSAVVNRLDPSRNGDLVKAANDLSRFSKPSKGNKGLMRLRKWSDEGAASLFAVAMIEMETVPLLCEFLPLPEAPSAILHYFPGLTSSQRGPRICVLRSPSTWSCLLNGIRELISRISRINGHDESIAAAQLVVSSLSHLNDSTPFERIRAVSASAIPGKLVAECWEAFKGTSRWFRQKHFDEFDDFGRNEYIRLVSAHCYMGIKIAAEELGDDKNMSVEKMREAMAKAFLVELNAFLDRGCSNHFGGYFGFRRKSYDKTTDPDSRVYVTTRKVIAWCFMIMRGIAWSMSTIGVVMGDPVPSSLFDHPRNVWIV